MQDGTYLSRNSATLGPLTSQPPCVGRLTGRCRIQLDRLESSVGGTQCKRSVGGSVAEKSLSGNLRTRSFHIPSAISFSIFGLSPTCPHPHRPFGSPVYDGCYAGSAGRPEHPSVTVRGTVGGQCRGWEGRARFHRPSTPN